MKIDLLGTLREVFFIAHQSPNIDLLKIILKLQFLIRIYIYDQSLFLFVSIFIINSSFMTPAMNIIMN